jgi:hypothetical protein
VCGTGGGTLVELVKCHLRNFNVEPKLSLLRNWCGTRRGTDAELVSGPMRNSISEPIFGNGGTEVELVVEPRWNFFRIMSALC